MLKFKPPVLYLSQRPREKSKEKSGREDSTILKYANGESAPGKQWAEKKIKSEAQLSGTADRYTDLIPLI